jgi:uncharacterized protein DUF5648/platelet-activating factor acetylhydrolase isoform II
MMDSTLRRIAAFLALTAAVGAVPALAFNHTDIATPVTLGPFPVACSNIAQDASRIAFGASATDYWEGRDHYVTELLTAPGTAVTFGVPVPDDSLYPGNHGRTVDFAAIVCYPTHMSNSDPSYVLPGTNDVVPHMQPAGAAPKLISQAEFLTGGGFNEYPQVPAMRLPLVLFSHGLTGSPISKGYITALVALASHGYMVAAPFHGDPRFSRVRVEDFTDVVYLLTQFDRVVEMQLMRPLSLTYMIDRLLGDAAYSPGIDADRIGGFGASLGGEAMLHLLGARITGTLGRSCRDAPFDRRLKAAVGFVPYAGQTFLPAFCDGQSGAASVDRPFLAMSGTADTTAPIAAMDDTIHQMKGSRYLVSMQGVPHQFIPEYAGDMFTWTVNFLNAYLQVPWDTGAMGRLIRMKGVNGGPNDTLVYDRHIPFASGPNERPVREFHNIILDHYFITSDPDEVGFVQRGGAGPGWELTGESFKSYAQMPAGVAGAAPVCRFYGGLNGGPNSHFFTAVQSECDQVKSGAFGGWFYEGIGFYIVPASGSGRCPDGLIGVNRAYNVGYPRNDSNHRFSTSDSTQREMIDQGWRDEGITMCAQP